MGNPRGGKKKLNNSFVLPPIKDPITHFIIFQVCVKDLSIDLWCLLLLRPLVLAKYTLKVYDNVGLVLYDE
jgi:hypothetical protein